METFWGLSELQWTAIEALAVVLSTLVVIVTAFLGYRQLRQASRSLQFSSVNRLQELIESFRQERKTLYTSFPLELVMSDDQFARKPPGRHKDHGLSEGERRRMLLTAEQSEALDSLSEEQLRTARIIINKLNDIGQLVEDQFVPKQVFFGKYHIMVIRCCHMVEPVRRRIEERMGGGNYGQRLLRLRKRSTVYNDIHPKHRGVPIYVTNGDEKTEVYKSETRIGILRRLRYFVRRWLSIY